MYSNGDIDITIEYDEERRVYRANYEKESYVPSLAIAESIAAIEGIGPTAMDPLGETVEMNSLDTLIQSSTNGSDLQITFSVQGYRIAVQGDGVIELRLIGSDRVN